MVWLTWTSVFQNQPLGEPDVYGAPRSPGESVQHSDKGSTGRGGAWGSSFEVASLDAGESLATP